MTSTTSRTAAEHPGWCDIADGEVRDEKLRTAPGLEWLTDHEHRSRSVHVNAECLETEVVLELVQYYDDNRLLSGSYLPQPLEREPGCTGSTLLAHPHPARQLLGGSCRYGPAVTRSPRG